MNFESDKGKKRRHSHSYLGWLLIVAKKQLPKRIFTAGQVQKPPKLLVNFIFT